MISKREFGCTAAGREVSEYVLDNGVIRAHVLSYGCILRKLLVRDCSGALRDVVLGYDDVRGYEENGGYLGAFIGRYANRIGGAKFTMDGKTHRLFANDGANTLHGGETGFNGKIYDCGIQVSEGAEQLVLSRISPDGEEGFPGNLEVKVTYFLSANGIEISYFAAADKDTPVNLTNHSYFNLDGEETILNHRVCINSDYITPVDKSLIPTGKLMQVKNTPFDFKKPEKVGKRIHYPHKQLEYAGGYDHNYVLKNYSAFEKVACFMSDKSGICMDVYTDNYGLQFYTGNFLGGEKGKEGAVYNKCAGLCFETQNFPNAVNQVSFPSSVLRPGQEFRSRTAYRFSALRPDGTTKGPNI